MRDGVIVADNDAVIRGILRSLLSTAVQNIYLANNGEEAVSLALTQKVRLLVLDLEMPRLNGFLACQRIRAIPGYAHIPAVILTGHDSSEARRAAALVGVSVFLTKPFQSANFMSLVAPFLGLDPAAMQTIHRAPVKVPKFPVSEIAPAERFRAKVRFQIPPSST